ncbi:MAG: putative alpha/beta superfamily hydrolase [Candidatus Krumholzibacteriia bacterium]
MATSFCSMAEAASPVGTPTTLSVGQSFPYSSAVFEDTRTLNVYLPADYDSSSTNYPVLYLLDGGVTQDFIPIVGMAALGPLSGQYRPFIVVGIQTENRYFELTTPSEIERDVQAIPNNGGAEKLRRYIVDEVKPWVAANYRTSGEDAVIGESLAGLFISETFLTAPETFTHYIAVSPSMWWRDMSLSKEAMALLQGDDFPSDRSIYLTIADEGGIMLEGVERLAEALKNHAPAGTKWWYEPMPNEHHNTIYNPATLQALRLIFAPQTEGKNP